MSLSLDGISKIVEKYDLFLIDLYGVMHNGMTPYADAIDVVCRLRNMGKRVVFFSNSPRPAEVVERQLLSMSSMLCGFEIVTSGECFINVVKNPALYNMKFLKEKAFAIVNDGDHYLISDAYGLKLADSLDQAGYIIVVAYVQNEDKLSIFDDIMQRAAQKSLPCICPNPDLVAHLGDKILYTAGSFAKRYENFGGVVKYVGKPDHVIYNYALRDSKVHSSRVLAIGDNLYTDIKGAIDYKIDCLFIEKGVHCDENARNLMQSTGLRPTYMINLLKY